MPETARTPNRGPTMAQLERPSLEVVRDHFHPASAEAAASEEPNVGRTAMIGFAVGFIAVAVGITVAGTLGGLGFVASLGIGSFVGIFGGGGFGFMMGGTVPLARHHDAHPARSNPPRTRRNP